MWPVRLQKPEIPWRCPWCVSVNGWKLPQESRLYPAQHLEGNGKTAAAGPHGYFEGPWLMDAWVEDAPAAMIGVPNGFLKMMYQNFCGRTITTTG